MVLPQPAAAATTITGALDGAVTGGCRRGRETTSVTTGGENFSAEYPPTVGLVPGGRFPAHPRAFQERPCVRGAGATMANEYTFVLQGTDQPAHPRRAPRVLTS